MRNSRRSEEIAYLEFNTEPGANACEHAGRHERVAAQFEEVVVNADLFAAKKTAPDGREGFLGSVPRRRKRGGKDRAGFFRCRESFVVLSFHRLKGRTGQNSSGRN